tara:strand:- start:34622 stop:35248 length:627 start_codon:yes stop_codon:yes gene_type:complete
MKDLQYIVVLCVVIVSVVAGGVFIASLGAKHSQTQIDPPSLQLDAGPSDIDLDEAPTPGDSENPILVPDPALPITSFEECVAAGNPVMESYPRQCSAAGKTFVEEIAEPVACTQEAKMCPDGSFVGRTGPNCEFEACPDADVSEEVVVCTDEMKEQKYCTREYAPVCGQVEVQCITTPCDPQPQTFSNGCTACSQGNVSSYTEGMCEE